MHYLIWPRLSDDATGKLKKHMSDDDAEQDSSAAKMLDQGEVTLQQAALLLGALQRHLAARPSTDLVNHARSKRSSAHKAGSGAAAEERRGERAERPEEGRQAVIFQHRLFELFRWPATRISTSVESRLQEFITCLENAGRHDLGL